MSRTYSGTPEPRYVEKAAVAEALEGGASVSAPSYLTITNIYSVEKGFRITYTVDGEEAEIEIPLEGTDDIVVDVDEKNTMINVHLDATVRNKLAKMLVLPTDTPTEQSWVGVGTNGAENIFTSTQLRNELGVKKSQTLTQAAYDALTAVDANTDYIIIPEA